MINRKLPLTLDTDNATKTTFEYYLHHFPVLLFFLQTKPTQSCQIMTLLTSTDTKWCRVKLTIYFPKAFFFTNCMQQNFLILPFFTKHVNNQAQLKHQTCYVELRPQFLESRLKLYTISGYSWFKFLFQG